MANRKIKNKQQTYEVSENELQDYYSRYLPKLVSGGLPPTNPWFKLANLGKKMGNLKNVNNDDVKLKDYMKFSITNTAKKGDKSGDELEFLTNPDGSLMLDEQGEKQANPLFDTGNRYLNFDENMDPTLLSYGEQRGKILNPIIGSDTERVKSGRFSARKVNPVTGKVEYVSDDESTRTSGDIAEDQLEAYNAHSFNFDEDNNVESWNKVQYNDYEEPTGYITNPYSADNPYNIGEHSKQSELNPVITPPVVDPVIDPNDPNRPKSQKEIEEEYRRSLDEANSAKYGRELPKAQNQLETEFENWGAQFDEAALQGELDAQAENYGVASTGDIDPTTGAPTVGALSTYGEVWSGEGWDDVQGVTPDTEQIGNANYGNFDINSNIDPENLTLNEDMLAASQKAVKPYNRQVKKERKRTEKENEKALKLANKETKAKKNAKFGDTFAQQATNVGNYALDKIGQSKFAAGSDLLRDGFSIYNDFKGAQEAEVMKQKPIQGMNTIDNLVTPVEVNSEGSRGNYDTNTGLLRIDDAVVSEMAKYGTELDEYQFRGEYSPNNFGTIKPYVNPNYFPSINYNPNFLQTDDEGSLWPFNIDMGGRWQDDVGLHTRQSLSVPTFDPETQEWIQKPYETSFMQELERSTHLEPTATFTSAGGPGVGNRIYYPYSDPVGVGLEMDVDPTGPGAGFLINNYRVRQAGNWLAEKTGFESFNDMDVPPGYTYAGVEYAGNLPMPFLGATISIEDLDQLDSWLAKPEHSTAQATADGFKHALGPGLTYWNSASKLKGSTTIPNYLNPTAKPWYTSPDLFNGRTIHNPISGTGVGLGGRTGIRGANFIPHIDIAGKEILTVRGGYANVMDEVADVAKAKNISKAQAYRQITGKFDLGKYISKTGIPSALDAIGNTIYPSQGAAAYDATRGADILHNIKGAENYREAKGMQSALGELLKGKSTFPNYLRNAKVPYGRLLNNPGIWRTLGRVLMVPDLVDLARGVVHEKGEEYGSMWNLFEPDPRLSQYGAFPQWKNAFNAGEDKRVSAVSSRADVDANYTRIMRMKHNLDQNLTEKELDAEIRKIEKRDFPSVKDRKDDLESFSKSLNWDKTLVNSKNMHKAYNVYYSLVGEESKEQLRRTFQKELGLDGNLSGTQLEGTIIMLISDLMQAGKWKMPENIEQYENQLGYRDEEVMDRAQNTTLQSLLEDSETTRGQQIVTDVNNSPFGTTQRMEWSDAPKENGYATGFVPTKYMKATNEKGFQKWSPNHIPVPIGTNVMRPEEFQIGGEQPNFLSLRKFTDEMDSQVGYNQEDILTQKMSLNQMAQGGEQIMNIDQQLLQELIAAGADIEIL